MLHDVHVHTCAIQYCVLDLVFCGKLSSQFELIFFVAQDDKEYRQQKFKKKLRWPNTVFACKRQKAHAKKKTNMVLIHQSFYFLYAYVVGQFVLYVRMIST